jgi:hypothetical protein
MTILGGRDGNSLFMLPTDLPSGATSELMVERDGGTLNDPLTAGSWTMPSPLMVVYTNPSAPAGGEVKQIILRPDRIVVIAKGTGTMPAPDGTSGDIKLTLVAGDRSFCARATAPHARDLSGRTIVSREQQPPLDCSAP